MWCLFPSSVRPPSPSAACNPRSDPLGVIVRDRAFLFLSSKDRTQRPRPAFEAARRVVQTAEGGRLFGPFFSFLSLFLSPPEFGRGSEQSCRHFFRPLKNKSSDCRGKWP